MALVKAQVKCSSVKFNKNFGIELNYCLFVGIILNDKLDCNETSVNIDIFGK